MCLAIPRRVLEAEGSRLQVDWHGTPRSVHAADGIDARIGGYVLVYADVAIETVAPEEAEEQLRFLAELGSALDGEGDS